MKITSSRTGFVHMLVVACFALSPSAGIANNDYTKTVADGIADVALTANDTIITDKLSGDGVDTLRFTRTSDFHSVKLRSAGGNDLPGGIIADGFLLKIQNPDVLGTGPVLLKNQWSGLFGDVYSSLDAIDVRNRVVFDTADSFAAGENAKKLVLHNIGTTEANAGKIVTLGRDGTGVANVTLSLDGSENDAIGSFNLRGDLSLTIDGGTLRAAATGSDRDLFQKANAHATPKITIENAPLAIDVARGGGARSASAFRPPTRATRRSPFLQKNTSRLIGVLRLETRIGRSAMAASTLKVPTLTPKANGRRTTATNMQWSAMERRSRAISTSLPTGNGAWCWSRDAGTGIIHSTSRPL